MKSRRAARSRTAGKRSGTAPLPEAEIRRFDVFAEWNRLKGLEEKRLSAVEAKAYGLAVAKVVAGRRCRPGEPRPRHEAGEGAAGPSGGPGRHDWWRTLANAREFDGVIAGRMGKEFYRAVFRPALFRAWKKGLEYAGIRDSIREDWNRRRSRAEPSAPSTSEFRVTFSRRRDPRG